MLVLVFQVGEERYAIEGSRTVEVLPLVQWNRVPHAPAGLAGIFDYHGAAVPLIDLAELMLGRTSRLWMSTRIVVVSERQGDRSRLLGLLAENITQPLHLDEKDFPKDSSAISQAPYLGGVTIKAQGLIQWIEISHLLPPEARRKLMPLGSDPV